MRLPEDAARALEKLESAGWESYAVGGCVRDSLLGIEPHDWDLCTAAPPEAMKKVFAGERVIETGLKHGTLTLLAPSGPLEITTFRTESGYSDCRHPDRVSFVRDIHADLARRDFTVNAMAYSPVRGLRDDFGGREDLRNGVLRCVGDPGERFREDALRILRALRFAARFGLTIEEETAAALRENRELLHNISPERIFSELKGILCARGAGEMLLAFPEVFFVILPELAPMRGFDTRRPQNHCWDVWGHTAHAVDAIAPESVLRLTMLFHDSGKPETFRYDAQAGFGRFPGHPAVSARIADAALRALRCDNAARERVVTLVENHEMRTGHGKKDLRRLLAKIGEKNMHDLLLVRRADAAAHAPEAAARLTALADEDERILHEITAERGCLHVKDLAVSGNDLLALGLKPGAAVGETLSRLLDLVLDEEVPNEKGALLAAARKEMQTHE